MNRDNQQPSLITYKEGSTTIENIANEKYISEEVSRVGKNSEMGGIIYLVTEYMDEDIV